MWRNLKDTNDSSWGKHQPSASKCDQMLVLNHTHTHTHNMRKRTEKEGKQCGLQIQQANIFARKRGLSLGGIDRNEHAPAGTGTATGPWHGLFKTDMHISVNTQCRLSVRKYRFSTPDILTSDNTLLFLPFINDASDLTNLIYARTALIRCVYST